MHLIDVKITGIGTETAGTIFDKRTPIQLFFAQDVFFDKMSEMAMLFEYTLDLDLLMLVHIDGNDIRIAFFEIKIDIVVQKRFHASPLYHTPLNFDDFMEDLIIGNHHWLNFHGLNLYFTCRNYILYGI